MKLEEMADLLDGLVDFMGKHAGKSTLNDLKAVSDCFRRFPGENVGTFCNFIVGAKENKSVRKQAQAVDQDKVETYRARIQGMLDDRSRLDYSSIRVLIAEIDKKLKIPEIKTLGETLGFKFPGNTKKAMLGTLENWLSNLKMSADQSSFSMTALPVG